MLNLLKLQNIAQLQKFEDSAPDSLEFERLKEHFDPFIRASLFSSTGKDRSRSKDEMVEYRRASLHSSSGKDRSRNKDEMVEYRSRVDITKASAHGTGGGEVDVIFMSNLEDIGQVATLEQRWINSWVNPLQTR